MHAAQNPSVIAILQARTSSTRLPGKVLLPIVGKPMLALQIERIARARAIDQLIVATSDEPGDNALADLCLALGVHCYRGSLNDVLDRFYQAVQSLAPRVPQHIVRLTGDCPLLSPRLLDALVQQHLEAGADYSCNCYPPSLPDGLDAEVVRWSTLARAWAEAPPGLHREHVTSYVRDQMAGVKKAVYQHPQNYSSLRLTVDYPEDFTLVTRIYEALYPQQPDFELEAVIDLLGANPQWLRINQTFERNSEYLKALGQLNSFQSTRE